MPGGEIWFLSKSDRVLTLCILDFSNDFSDISNKLPATFQDMERSTEFVGDEWFEEAHLDCEPSAEEDTWIPIGIAALRVLAGALEAAGWEWVADAEIRDHVAFVAGGTRCSHAPPRGTATVEYPGEQAFAPKRSRVIRSTGL